MSEGLPKTGGAAASAAPSTDYDLALQKARAVRDKILEGICPECDAPALQATRDARQAGPSSVAGSWHNVQCGSCGFFCDMVLPEGRA